LLEPQRTHELYAYGHQLVFPMGEALASSQAYARENELGETSSGQEHDENNTEDVAS
jgi:hypothetical protein